MFCLLHILLSLSKFELIFVLVITFSHVFAVFSPLIYSSLLVPASRVFFFSCPPWQRYISFVMLLQIVHPSHPSNSLVCSAPFPPTVCNSNLLYIQPCYPCTVWLIARLRWGGGGGVGGGGCRGGVDSAMLAGGGGGRTLLSHFLDNG